MRNYRRNLPCGGLPIYRQGSTPPARWEARAMNEPKVWIFFYGSFINREVLARGGLALEKVEVARLWGYDIRVETLATLVRSDEHCVYGIVCQATHAELRGLYGQDWLG